MIDKNKKIASRNEALIQLIRGLLIGKALTLVVIGGLFWWLVRINVFSFNYYAADKAEIASATGASTFENTDVPSGSFNYGGSTAWAPIRQLVDAQIQSAYPQMQLRYINPANGSPGSSTGIRMLLAGELDFAQTTRPLTDAELAIARRKGLALEQRAVGIDGIAVVVNHSLNVPGLTIDQLQQIYRGVFTNWRQVGGPDLPITPFSQSSEAADTAIFSANSLPSFGSNVQYVYSTTEALRKVNSIPGGLYYASARGVVPQCSVKPLPLGRTATQLIPPYREPLVAPEQCPRQRNQLNTTVLKNGSYPIVTNLFVVIKQNQSQEQQAGTAYANLLLSDQGQEAIKQAGFVLR